MNDDAKETLAYACVAGRGDKCRVEIIAETKEDADMLLLAILSGFAKTFISLGVSREDVIDYMSRAGKVGAENIVGEDSFCDVYVRDSSEEPKGFCE